MSDARARFSLPLDIQHRFAESDDGAVHQQPLQYDQIERLLTASQVAEALAVSERTIRRLVQQGDLVAHRVRSLPRFRMSDVLAFIERSQGRR